MKVLSIVEKHLMYALWQLGPTSLDNLVDYISSWRELDKVTVRRYLRRMKKDGFVAVKYEKFKRKYYAAVSTRKCLQDYFMYLKKMVFPNMTAELISACFPTEKNKEDLSNSIYTAAKDVLNKKDIRDSEDGKE